MNYMDTSFILNFISEIAYFLVFFGVFLFLALVKGRQALINIIFSLYLALLISIEFPFYDSLLSTFSTSKGLASGQLVLFLVFTTVFYFLTMRIMPDEYREKKFESFGKKLLLTFSATILVMIFSFQVLPVTEFLTPGTPLQSLFAGESYYFWWLLVPLIILFIN